MDAKPSIQARGRCPHRPGRPRRAVRVEHEYERNGAWPCWRPGRGHRGSVRRHPGTTGIAPFMDLIGRSWSGRSTDAPRVFVIVDNGSDHRGRPPSAVREAHPNAIMIHAPVHASWLNQIEIVFSVVQKKVLTPGDFPGLGALSHALLAFVDRYNRTARPFNWKYTADDLTALLHRIGQHEQAPASQQAPSPRAA